MPEVQPSRTCFLICPIGKEGSETRQRSDKIQKHILEPILKANGYVVTRADQISEPGTITAQIVERLVEDDLVIADMTDHNPNVFYELAIRHAYKKQVIQFISSDQKIPFDVAGMRAIPLEYTDIGSVREFEREFDKQLKAINSGVAIDNPIISATDLTVLRQSGDEQQRALAKIFEKLERFEVTQVALLANRRYEPLSFTTYTNWDIEFSGIINALTALCIFDESSHTDNRIAKISNSLQYLKNDVLKETQRFID